MGQPLVSVLMTAYNREKYIASAIESVLSSAYANFELIIVDDGSVDKTFEIAEGYLKKDDRIQLFKNEKNLGDYANRNRASEYAKGKYLKYVDSDDMISADGLQVMVDAMEAHPEAGFGVCATAEDKITEYSPRDAYYNHFFKKRMLDFGPTGIIIVKEKFELCKKFKEIRNVSDFDMWLRMASKWPVLEMPEKLIFWREHDGQEIKIAPEYYLEYTLPIIEENLDDSLCPLTAKEKTIVLKKYRKASAKALIKNIIRRKKIKYSFSLWHRFHLNIFDLF